MSLQEVSLDNIDVSEPQVELDNAFLLRVLQTINIGVVLVETKTLKIIFENANFFKWFPPKADADELLNERLPRFKMDRAKSRLEAGRPYTYEVETNTGEHGTPVVGELRSQGNPFEHLSVVECHDITKQRQSEKIHESFSMMAEKCPGAQTGKGPGRTLPA